MGNEIKVKGCFADIINNLDAKAIVSVFIATKEGKQRQVFKNVRVYSLYDSDAYADYQVIGIAFAGNGDVCGITINIFIEERR